MRLDESPQSSAVLRRLVMRLVATGQWYRLDDCETAEDLDRHPSYQWQPSDKRARPWLVVRLLSGRADAGQAYHRTVVVHPRTASGDVGLQQGPHPRRHGCTIRKPGRIRRIDVDMDTEKLLGHYSCTEDDPALLSELKIDEPTA